MWRHDSSLWKWLRSFPSTGSISVVKALLGSFYCPDILGIPSTYFISKVWTLSALACQSVSATGLLYEMKAILPVGESLIFAQLAEAAWKDLGVFWQLNNVNLKPINILLQFGLRKICSTLNKRREQHLFSIEALHSHPWNHNRHAGPYCMVFKKKCGVKKQWSNSGLFCHV